MPGRLVALVDGSGESLDVPVLGTRRLGLRTLRKLRAQANEAGLLVSHGSSTLPAGVAATWMSKTRLVYRSIGDPRYWASSARKRAQIGLQLRRASMVIASTEEAAQVIVETYRVPREAIRVIPKGADVGRTDAAGGIGRREIDPCSPRDR